MIDINRHNYETFFLLYVDKELPAADCRLVENFVQQNPDLEIELQQFKATMLDETTDTFFDKTALLRSTQFNTHIQNRLLTALDQELPEDEMQALQEIIESDPMVKETWTVLQQCKLDDAEEIVYPNKADLYQKEKHKIRPVYWWRLAAAALFIGAGTWGALQYIQPNKQIVNESVVVTAPPSKKLNPINETKNLSNPLPIENAVEQTAPLDASTSTIEKNSTSTAVKLKEPSKEESSLEKFNSNTGNENNRTIVLTENSVVPNNSGITGNIQPEKTNETNATTANNVVLNTSLTEEAMPIVYNTLSVDEDEQQTKRTRVGGLFRKLKRALNRNANPEAEKKGLRVASFQIAIH